MSVLNKPAQLLEDGWRWVEYDDGSGHLENPNGKSVISYDYTTQEYRDVHSNYDKKCITPLDCFDIAIGYDIEGKDYSEAILFIHSYIDSNYSELIALENSYFVNDTLS